MSSALASALKNREQDSARKQMVGPMPGDSGGPPSVGGGDMLAKLVQSLSPQDKAQLLKMLTADEENAESPGEEQLEQKPQDEAGQSKITPAELEELKQMGASMFGAKAQPDDEELNGPGGKKPGLMDRMNSSVNKFFKK